MNDCKQQASLWATAASHSLNKASLIALTTNDLPYIRIPGFATLQECNDLLAEASREGFSAYHDVEPRIDRIGMTVFEYSRISKGAYFERHREMKSVQDRIFSRSFNPIRRFMDLLASSTAMRVNVACNDDGQNYYAGLIRRIESSTLIHVDFAPAEQPDWEVGRIQHQMAWNLYLRTTTSNDGRTHIFNRQWQPPDEQYKSSYGYTNKVVAEADRVVFEPVAGDVIIFNTRNYHFVEKTIGERVTVTSALGMLDSNRMVLWS